MILYCRYMGLGISWDYNSLEFIKNQSLLKDCKDMEATYDKSLSLWLITAKISYLSPITRPNVLKYLRMILKIDNTANICYLIGLQCDVIYGNYELAKRYWLQGYQFDSNFFPLCYLKATILQQKNNYFEAVALFYRVIKFIQEGGKYSFRMYQKLSSYIMRWNTLQISQSFIIMTFPCRNAWINRLQH